MKKFLLCIFSFLFIGTALAGSCFLLAGCDSSYSQQSPSDENLGEDGQNNNEENTENGDESNLDNGQDNEDGTELNQGEDESENDDEVSAQTDHNFYLLLAQILFSNHPLTLTLLLWGWCGIFGLSKI